MNVLNALITLIKVKFWFATVNQYRGLKARLALRKYEKTLSPKQREYARNLRHWLASAKTPDAAAGILVKEARRLQEEQMRLVERIDRVSQNDQVLHTSSGCGPGVGGGGGRAP